MVVAVAVARVMEVTVDDVVDVIAVRNGVVPAGRPVLVRGGVRSAGVRRRAGRRIRGAHFDHVLVHVIAVHVVKMAVVGVVPVPFVRDGRVTAAGAVGVRMSLVGLVIAHGVVA